MEEEAEKSRFYSASIDIPSPNLSIPTPESHNRSQSVTTNFPVFVSALDVDQFQKIMFNDKAATDVVNGQPNNPQNGESNTLTPIKHSRNFSQHLCVNISSAKKFSRLPRHERFNNKSYDSFKTWYGKLEKPISNLHGNSSQSSDFNNSQDTEAECLPTLDRYFDALEGPELDTLRESEELVLPEDKKWPFLLRFPISSFGVCLGVGSQAVLWKTLASSPTMSFMNVSLKVNLVLWCIAVAVFSLVASIYALKIIFYFEAVRREYYHPVRMNFFFAPWISCLFLAISLPPHVAKNIPNVLWYVLMTPILCLELKIYGQWMSGGERRLSKVANPSNHLSVVGNFVGAFLGATMGLKEGPIFFFAVGVAHYIVLFVTLYQRLPTNETLPKELHPVFFLFIAAPNSACTSWAAISGDFGIGARIPYFIAMFLYASLVVRINFFRGFRFSLAWWAYTFPMASAAVTTIRYTEEVNNVTTKTIAAILSTFSTFTVSVLLTCTILQAFVFHNLFPNDFAIAISHEKSKPKKMCSHFSSPDLEACESPPAKYAQ